MTLHTYETYFENWRITNTNYQLIAVTNLKNKQTSCYQGEEADPIDEKFDELDTSEFLDWFYNNELDGNIDHENYTLDKEDLEYIKENPQFFYECEQCSEKDNCTINDLGLLPCERE